jgi:hypothetical protein
MILIGLFWIGLQIILLSVGFLPIPVLLFVTLGLIITTLICMYLDIYNDKVGKWFDNKEFFKK